jgi:hypothetical protein
MCVDSTIQYRYNISLYGGVIAGMPFDVLICSVSLL